MKPTIRIDIDGQPSDQVTVRLLSLTATDESGTRSDRLDMTFDNRTPRMEIPPKGVRVLAAIGWGEAVPLGSYEVDVTGAGPGVIRVQAKAVSMRAKMKAPKTRSWENRTLGQIVETLASEHGFDAAIDPELANEIIPHLSQRAESDIALLTRLATERGVIAKPKGGALLMYRRGAQSHILHSDPVEIAPEDLGDWDWKSDARPQYNSVSAWWHDEDAETRQMLTVGDGEPSSEIAETFATETKARQAARARLERSMRKSGVLTGCKLAIGNPHIRSEGRVRISALESVPAALWTPDKVVHKVSKQGFTTEFNAERALEK